MRESEVNRENSRWNFRDAQHLATRDRFDAYDFQLPRRESAGWRVTACKPGDTSFLDGIGLAWVPKP